MQGNIGSTNISELPINTSLSSNNPPMQQPTMQQSTMQQPTMQQPTMQQSTMQQPTMQQISQLDSNSKNTVIMDNNITQKSYNELVGQIQQADKLGVTQLPSRDVPNNTDNIVMDNQTNPNYIPEQEILEDYIKNYETPDNVIINEENNEKNKDRLEELYTKLQMPLLVSILYFLFNLPVIRKYMYKYIPNLFNKDGNANLFGYLVNSILFGALYYFISTSVNNIINY